MLLHFFILILSSFFGVLSINGMIPRDKGTVPVVQKKLTLDALPLDIHEAIVGRVVQKTTSLPEAITAIRSYLYVVGTKKNYLRECDDLQIPLIHTLAKRYTKGDKVPVIFLLNTPVARRFLRTYVMSEEGKKEYDACVYGWMPKNFRDEFAKHTMVYPATTIEQGGVRYTPLAVAVDTKNNAAAHYLVPISNLEQRVGQQGNGTVLQWAACNGSLPLVKLLLEAGASVDVLLLGCLDRITALSYAADKAYPDIVEALLKAGASTDVNNFDAEPLYEAMRKKYKAYYGWCPTMSARYCRILTLLRQYGAPGSGWCTIS